MIRDLDADYLAELRASAAEVRADLEERERLFDADPEGMHDAVMAATRPRELPHVGQLVHKEFSGRQLPGRTLPGDANDDDPMTADQIEIISMVLAEVTIEFQNAIADAAAPLRERIAVLEGQLSMLTNLIGGNGRSFEASETIRKIRMGERG